VAELGGRIIGSAGAQRVTQAFLTAHSDRYERATDGNAFAASHTPRGEIYQLIGVGVAPEFRGDRLGRQLVDRQIDFARLLPGIRRIMGFTRPAGYHRHRQLAIEDYVQLRGESGRLVDPILEFHLGAGATIVSIHPNFRDDEDACGYGVLIEYAVTPR
jgi:GNAT superfamily N-acetyltransferase